MERERAVDAREGTDRDIVHHRGGLVRLFRFRQKIDEDGKALEITSKARAVSFEPDALKMGREGSVLSAACAEGDPEIYIHRHRRQCVGRIVAEEFWDESTDEHDVVLVITERTPDGQQRRRGEIGAAGRIGVMMRVFAHLRKPSQRRRASAASGPRSPVWRRSR